MPNDEVQQDEMIQDKELSLDNYGTRPFEVPDKFHHIPDEVIELVDSLMTPVIYDTTPQRDVDIEGILQNAKAVFKDGRNYYDKDYWIQHCAASVREIIFEVKPENFSNVYTGIPAQGTPGFDDFYLFIEYAKNYLSNIIHHRPHNLKKYVEKMFSNHGYDQMNQDDFFDKEDQIFEKVCINLIYTLKDLLTYRENNEDESN